MRIKSLNYFNYFFYKLKIVRFSIKQDSNKSNATKNTYQKILAF